MLTNDELIERGTDSEALLADPVFVRVMDDLTNYHLAALVQAPPGPGAQDAREHHHLLLHALKEIEGTLQGYAEVAKRHLENATADEAEVISAADKL